MDAGRTGPHGGPDGGSVVIRVPKQSLTRWAFRFVAGRPLDGHRRTDARFLVAGTRSLDVTGHASRWAMLPGWRRAAWRIGTLIVVAAAVTGWVMAPAHTLAVFGALAVSGVMLGCVRAVRAVRTYRHIRHVVRPLARTVGRQLGYASTRPYGDWLTVPYDFHAPNYTRDRTDLDSDRTSPDTDPDSDRTTPDTVRLDGEIVIKLPDVMPDAPDVQRTIHRTVAAKLGLSVGDLDARWMLAGRDPQARFRRAPRPPKQVRHDDLAAELHAARDGRPVLGIGARDRVVTVDLDSDAPHIAISCGTGAGKSALVRALIAQFLHHGTQVLILDPKAVSQRWCKDLPGVTYCRTGEQMHNAIIGFAAEVRRRSDVVDSTPAADDTMPDVGPRMVLVMEEQNIAVQFLTAFWSSIRDPKTDPRRSPALSALDHILCAGREFKAHVVSVAQMFTVQAAGGNPAARENYGIRILARATRNAWLMLAPEAGPPYPRASRARGRMHVVLAGESTEVQAVFLSVPEARALASAGTPVTVPATWTAGTDQRDSASTVTPGPRFYSLAEAARQEWCTLSSDALRQAKSRAGERFPAGREIAGQRKWAEGELRDFLALRAGQSTP